MLDQKVIEKFEKNLVDVLEAFDDAVEKNNQEEISYFRGMVAGYRETYEYLYGVGCKKASIELYQKFNLQRV